MDEIHILQQIIDTSSSIVFFGGAGVSTESGIPDFRSTGGLYNQEWKYPPETILSRSFFNAYPKEFYRFYRSKMLFPQAKPNAAHTKLAQLENAGKLKAVITQNIDGLHQAAGSKTVYELHGSVLRNYCMNCGPRVHKNRALWRHGKTGCSAVRRKLKYRHSFKKCCCRCRSRHAYYRRNVAGGVSCRFVNSML